MFKVENVMIPETRNDIFNPIIMLKKLPIITALKDVQCIQHSIALKLYLM